jgi:hypothetical protein
VKFFSCFSSSDVLPNTVTVESLQVMSNLSVSPESKEEKMKWSLRVFLGCVLVLFSGAAALASPVDLTSFASFPDDTRVTLTGGTVAFSNDGVAMASFYNDAFLVPSDATLLSFSYDFTQTANSFDYFRFVINDPDNPVLLVTASVSGASFGISLSAWRGQTISLAWDLLWDGVNPQSLASTATVSNVDLQTQAVPLPATIILLGSGLAGMIGFRARRVH